MTLSRTTGTSGVTTGVECGGEVVTTGRPADDAREDDRAATVAEGVNSMGG
ncbi:hypothetical protein SAMN05216188_102633 [Lentzea xinjiangensis]|uniref:Uncharacterized protein n=1 Tax=Lentzea xinjiangensis TaxID=402600 RepID=A0A1H9EQN7_9PSEU|nr:hypothetical protein [Lentzea xinjiangensis]SEQ27979.1 hypothetical protein SAMN05216188_102633 [Lentzea xinjiangensis]